MKMNRKKLLREKSLVPDYKTLAFAGVRLRGEAALRKQQREFVKNSFQRKFKKYRNTPRISNTLLHIGFKPATTDA